jgi:hypothetical protein
MVQFHLGTLLFHCRYISRICHLALFLMKNLHHASHLSRYLMVRYIVANYWFIEYVGSIPTCLISYLILLL